MALTCNRHPFEYAENVCSSCGMAFCHDCLVYPRPKKPPLCVPCAIATAGVRSSARNHSNLSRREVKKRVRAAKGLQPPQPQVEAPAAASTDRDFELTSHASFDQGWAVSWDEGRDPHPGYPEPVHVSWGNEPSPPREAEADEPPITPAAAQAPADLAVGAPPAAAPEPAPAPPAAAPKPEPTRPAPRPPELPRLQPVVAERAPERPAAKLAEASAQAAAPAPPPAAPSPERLRRHEPDPGEATEMFGWLDDLLGTEKDKTQG